MNKNAIFIHAAILPKCKERLIQYLDLIVKSGLIENVKYIFICFVGPEKVPITEETVNNYNKNNNICVYKVSEKLEDFELPTLNFINQFAKNNPEFNVLYLHTKGVGKEINLCIEDQIEYMLYFNVLKWRDCVNALIECDTCGVDLRTEPVLHYSGNFWWSTTSNINSLPTIVEFHNIEKFPNPLNSLRHNQEFWICYNKNKKHFALWDCGINCYERHLHRFNKELYFNTNE
jgi:hypothetical protein